MDVFEGIMRSLKLPDECNHSLTTRKELSQKNDDRSTEVLNLFIKSNSS